jgi:alkylated DNA nucleotide flippase Atl1
MASQSITTILAKAVKEKGVDIPFHRIVYADGHVWLDDKHKQKRLNLYKKEGIKLDTNNKIKDFADKLWEFL